MKPFIALAGALLVANSVLADPYSAAIQQAKRVSAQETAANQKLMENPPAAAPQSAPNQQDNPVLQATLKNIENLRADFVTLAGLTNAASIAAEKQGLTNDLATAAQAAKPPAQSISKLADDLAAVIAGNPKLRPQHHTLAQYVHAAFNGSQLSLAQQQMIFGGIQKMLANGGATLNDATNVVNDVKTIVSQTK